MGKSTTLPIFVLSLLLFLGLGAWARWGFMPRLRSQSEVLERLERRLEQIEQSLALLHFSGDPEGRPIGAVLEHLEYWSARDEKFGSSLAERPVITEKLRLAMNALRKLGKPAYDEVERAFDAAASDPKQRPFRRRLLRVLRDLDPERTKQRCATLLTTPGSDPRVRTAAGEILVELDPDLAGARLRHVILTETASGVRHQLPVGEAKAFPSKLEFRGFPGFFNLVNQYIRSRDESKVDVLLVVLRTGGHTPATLQAAIDGLTQKKAAEAVDPLKRMFEKPATNEQKNVYVRRRIARAIVEIDGTNACLWLREQLAKEKVATVSSTIAQLLKAHCGR